MRRSVAVLVDHPPAVVERATSAPEAVRHVRRLRRFSAPAIRDVGDDNARALGQKRRAYAKPRPAAPPVTIATLPRAVRSRVCSITRRE